MTSFTFICDARCCQLGSMWVQVCLSWLMHNLCLSRPQCPSRGPEGTTWSQMLIATHLWMFSCQEKCCCDKFIVYHTCSVCHCCRYCFPQSSSLFTRCHRQATCSNQRPGASPHSCCWCEASSFYLDATSRLHLEFLVVLILHPGKPVPWNDSNDTWLTHSPRPWSLGTCWIHVFPWVTLTHPSFKRPTIPRELTSNASKSYRIWCACLSKFNSQVLLPVPRGQHLVLLLSVFPLSGPFPCSPQLPRFPFFRPPLNTVIEMNL